MNDLASIVRLIRFYCLLSTTEAGSGHPTSCLSAADLMTGLLFGGIFRFDPEHPHHPNNDRLIFSKGHAAPLLYALWAAAGRVTEKELLSLRNFGSPLEGHPTPAFPYAEAATGSLGQGLSIGVGMAMNAKFFDKLPYRTYVLLGDSEMAEGEVWEAMALAAHYKLGNLAAIVDVNRLGQRGQTMHGHDLEAYRAKAEAFGWEPFVIDGHDLDQIRGTYELAAGAADTPVMIIAKTVKGKGVSFIEDRDGWHGKALSKNELNNAIAELGKIDPAVRGAIPVPADLRPPGNSAQRLAAPLTYDPGISVATRRAYGSALERLFPRHPDIVVLDAEVSNSTYAGLFKERYPDRFIEMYVAEQNMVGTAAGLALRGKAPFVSSFAAFLTRAFDQIRMARYSAASIRFCGSHAGVSIGEDGSSQMGLEDIALFRTIQGSVVFYPSDAVAAERLVEAMLKHGGISYLRTTRMETPLLYRNDEAFWAGGSKVLRSSSSDVAAIVAAGVTVHEALKAYEALAREGVKIRVIDLYSVKPADARTLLAAADDTGVIITVEDHVAEGGIGEAVRSALGGYPTEVHSLAVRKVPRSGKPGRLLDYEGISLDAIVRTVRKTLGTRRRTPR